MRDLLVQVYGIKPWGDLQGLLTILFLYGVLKSIASGRVQKWFWIVTQSYSGWGSLTILPRAIMRNDPATFVYHFAFVVFSVWFVATIWHPTWEETLAKFDAAHARFGVWLGDWVFDNITHRGQGGDHERL